MKVQMNLLTGNKYSRPCTELKQVKKIVVHYVGNPGSSAISNRNYFEGLKDKKKTYASSHYIIGLEGEIIQCIPENEIAYHASEANDYSIGIECCHADWGGKFNDRTYNSLIDLCMDICKRYKLNPLTDIIRHYDITKKKCPAYYIDHVADWEKILHDTKNKMNNIDTEYQKAVNVLIDRGIIGSPTAWYPIENINIKNVPALIKKIAKCL